MGYGFDHQLSRLRRVDAAAALALSANALSTAIGDYLGAVMLEKQALATVNNLYGPSLADLRLGAKQIKNAVGATPAIITAM